MSDEKNKGAPAGGSKPPPPPAPIPPPAMSSAPPVPAIAPPGTSSTPATPPPQSVIEYAMPTQKRSWLPSPALVKNLGCLFKVLVGLTVLICLGYFALVAMNPKARQWATQGGRDGSGGPTPFKALNQILAIPAQAIGKTKDVVAASDARTGMLNGVIAEEEGKLKRGGGKSGPAADPFAAANAILNGSPASPGPTAAPGSGPAQTDGPPVISAAALLAMSDKNPPRDSSGSAVPVTPSEIPRLPEPVAPTQVKLPGGIVISSASPAGAPAASQPFLYWVVGQNISGVFQNNPPRLLMNNHLIYENQEVNAPLGITFVRIDPVKKLILFRDKAGAEVTRSY